MDALAARARPVALAGDVRVVDHGGGVLEGGLLEQLQIGSALGCGETAALDQYILIGVGRGLHVKIELRVEAVQTGGLESGAQVDVQLACELGVPVVTSAVRITVDGATAEVERVLEDEVQTVQVSLPAVVSVTPDIALPRIPGL